MKIYRSVEEILDAARKSDLNVSTSEDYTMDELRSYLAREAGPVTYKQEANAAILQLITEGKVSAIKTKNGFMFVRTTKG